MKKIVGLLTVLAVGIFSYTAYAQGAFRGDGRQRAIQTPRLISFGKPWTSPYRVDEKTTFHFINDQGNHLYIVNKTAWAYFGCEHPEAVLDRARAQGVNVIRVALEGEPYSQVLGIDLWPWGGTRDNPDWGAWNEDYWATVEHRIRMAGERGIGFDLVLYFDLVPDAEDVPHQRAYWDEVLHRLGKYSNIFTWEIMNEEIGNEAFQDIAGVYFHEHDPFHRPVCSSDGTTDDATWPQKEWMDIALNHSCTGSTERYPLDTWYLAVARNTRSHGKPAFCNESGRENRHHNDDGISRRKQGWIWATTGGYWTWHSWDGCEGIDSVDYQAPGAQYLQPMADYFRSVPFWQLSPNYTVLVPRDNNLVAPVLAGASRQFVTAYLCTKQTGTVVRGEKADLRLPDGRYLIEYLNPANLHSLKEDQLVSTGLRSTMEITLPDFTDDLVIRITNTAQQAKSLIPGTE